MSWCHVFAHVCTLCQFMGARVHARTHTQSLASMNGPDKTSPKAELRNALTVLGSPPLLQQNLISAFMGCV